MRTVIFAGGQGSRISDIENDLPKPLLDINGKPLIAYVLEIFSKNGLRDFTILTGYKSDQIEYYFKNNKKKYYNLNIKFLFTGVKSLTGKRIFLAKHLLQEDFFLTYSDGLANIDLKKLYNFHKRHKKLCTMTAVRPPVRFGELILSGNKIKSFEEKKQLNKGWINGGFFVINPGFFKFVPNRDIMFENGAIYNALKAKEIIAYKHNSFWQCVDTKKDYLELKKYMLNKETPWLNF
jgi:glucose-1-phosphate cytidylyltransferase